METTGKYLLSAKIIEIGILRVRNGQVVDEYNALVNPKCHIPYGATKVNHISDAMVEKAPYLENIIDEKSFSAVWSSGGTTGAKKGFHTQFKPETLALQELNELVGDIIEDGIITDDELFSLSEWMEAHTDLQGNAPFATVYFGFRKICKKKMSPIVLILIAAFTGIVVYGI